MNDSDTHLDDLADQAGIFRSLERSLPRVAPSPDLFDRVLAEIRTEATVVPLRSRPSGRPTVATAASALAAAAVLLVAIGLAVRDGGTGSPAARATLEARTEAGVIGEAAIFDPDAEGGRLEITLRAVPASPEGHHYEVWVLPEGSDEMLSVGTFSTEETRDVELELSLPGPGSYAAVDVSVEEDEGPPEHSDTSLATGFFT